MRKTREQKLADIEVAIRRWETKASRAINTLVKLRAKRARLLVVIAAKSSGDLASAARAARAFDFGGVK